MKKTATEKMHGHIIKMISFCKECSSVKVLRKDGHVFWEKSIVIFDHLPKEQCCSCLKNKKK